MADDGHDEWRRWLRRWSAVIDGLNGRAGTVDLEDLRFLGQQEPPEGVSNLLCLHELGDIDLTPAEEDELWSLMEGDEFEDTYLVPESVRARSVRNRPVRVLLPEQYLTGGAHGPETGARGKTEFPSSWSRDDCMRHTMDVARRPSSVRKLPSGDFRALGTRDGVDIGVVVSPEGRVQTSYPVRGPGVVHNPLDGVRAAAVQRLHALVEVMVGDDERRAVLDELVAVGEWPHVIASLRALDAELSVDQRRELDDLARLAGLAPTA